MARLSRSFTLLSSLIGMALVLPSLVVAQFDARTDPACCVSCWHEVLSTSLSNLAAQGSYSTGMAAWCNDGAMMSDLTACWNEACTDQNDIVAGQRAWDAACAYAQSTAAIYSQVQSAAAVETAAAATATVSAVAAPNGRLLARGVIEEAVKVRLEAREASNGERSNAIVDGTADEGCDAVDAGRKRRIRKRCF